MVASEILLVKIHRATEEGKDYYEATRGHWKINERRLKDIAYVAGVHRGNVVCAYIPNQWYVVQEGSDQGRKGFVGHEAPEVVLARLQDANDRLLKKFGQGQSIAYASMTDVE